MAISIHRRQYRDCFKCVCSTLFPVAHVKPATAGKSSAGKRDQNEDGKTKQSPGKRQQAPLKIEIFKTKRHSDGNKDHQCHIDQDSKKAFQFSFLLCFGSQGLTFFFQCAKKRRSLRSTDLSGSDRKALRKSISSVCSSRASWKTARE